MVSYLPQTRLHISAICLAVVTLGSIAGDKTVASQDYGPVADIPGSEKSELENLVRLFAADRSAILRRWDAPYSDNRRQRLDAFYEGWTIRLQDVRFDGLGLEGRIDFVLLQNLLNYESTRLDREARLVAEMIELVPFANDVISLHESRRDMEPVDAQHSADRLTNLADHIQAQVQNLETQIEGGSSPSQIVGLRASEWIADISDLLDSWYEHYSGYDPLFSWWNEQPYAQLDSMLGVYRDFLNEKVVGFRAGEDPPIVGDPIGVEGLLTDLQKEMVPYSPEELIAIAEQEFAWCEAKLLEASQELGYGDDWKAAQEHVKLLFVEPGAQPALVVELAHEAVEFITARNLVTVPPLAEEVWRMEMLSPERQKIAPFFLGGEVVRVAFPTDGMAHADKLMSLRGNNIHYSRAVVHHELIPGHHLQGFMTSRYNTHRRPFSTPFWGEGWALYWEMLLWDLNFPRGPEDEIGMLFWRMHRAARIIFSLKFHLGEMTPGEAIDFLVDRVGHERANATAEVRRSFNGAYPPLYQAAYMLGGLQFRALHSELVGSGQLTDQQFHDAILQGGSIPVEMVRARLTGNAPDIDHTASWMFNR